MSSLLHLDSSPRGDRSITRQLTHEFAEAWKAAHPGGTVTHRDLAESKVPFITEDWIAGAFAQGERTPEQNQALAVSDEFVAELKAADHYVFGVPMYNFSIPGAFKAYIDQIVRVGQTVNIGEKGFAGLLTGKKAIIITASGGVFREGTPLVSYNFQTPYLRTVLGFLGVVDVDFIVADGVNDVNFGKADRETYLKPIHAQVRERAVL